MHTPQESNNFTRVDRVDIEKLLESQAPRLAPCIPRWVVRSLERLLHIEQINDFMEDHYDDEPMEFVHQCVAYFELKTEIENEDSLKQIDAKRPIIVANHPLGGPESLVLIDALSSYSRDISMVAKGIIGEIKPLKPILVPIPTRGDPASVSRFRDAFSGDAPVIIFPAGYCSRPLSNGILFDFGWHSTFVKMARKFDRPLLPIHISGANSKRFYRMSTWRRRLRIRTSLESILLPDEMYRQQGKTVRLTVGNMIAPKVFDATVSDSVWADRVRSHVYRLGSEHDTIFDPAAKPVLPLT